MQVTHVDGNVTHAVIGKSKAIDFGISNSAEFFNILSNTLYSNKKLAVIREALCNAWDIHIQTGRTDQPVQVTLTRDKLTIRDFGTGIADDDMPAVYCTYGNSTKKNDGNQTGGFGLGCKAPFAYVDHFEVISYHDGKKTVYAISKSSAEVAGKPSLTQIVSVPTTESGLSVSMAIHPSDYMDFENLIKTIARFGEMNVLLNGDQLPTYPFSKAEFGFLLVPDTSGISGSANDRLYVRYGNVVYPIPEHQDYTKEYKRAYDFVARINGEANYYNRGSEPVYRAVLMAKPNTISVTPSRESLSMTSNTVEALKELLDDLGGRRLGDLSKECFAIYDNLMAKPEALSNPTHLLTRPKQIPGLYSNGMHGTVTTIAKFPSYIGNIREMGLARMARGYPSGIGGFKEHDQDTRMRLLIEQKYGGEKNRGRLQSYHEVIKQIRLADDRKGRYKLHAYRYHADARLLNQWYQNHILGPIFRKMETAEDLNPKKLYAYGYTRIPHEERNHRNYYKDHHFVEARKFRHKKGLEGYANFLRNILVLSYNRQDVEDRVSAFPVMKTMDSAVDYLVYITPRTDKKIANVRKFFEDMGFIIIDLTVAHPWEHQTVVLPTPKAKPMEPRQKGLPLLSESLTPEGKFKHDLISTKTSKRIEDMELVAQLNPRAQSSTLIHGLGRDQNTILVKLYGDICGVATNSNQFHRYLKMDGIEDLEVKMFTDLKKTVMESKTFQYYLNTNYRYLSVQDRYDLDDANGRYFFEHIVKIPELAIEFGLLNEMTEKEKMFAQLYEHVISDHSSWRHHFTHKAEVKEILSYTQKIDPLPEVVALARKLSASKLLKIFRPEQIASVFEQNASKTRSKGQKKIQSDVLDILLYALA